MGAAALLLALLTQIGATGRTPALAAHPDVASTITATLHLPLVQRPAPRLLIAAAHIDSAISGEGDEALWLWNSSPETVALAGWQIDGNGRIATFPITTSLHLPPATGLWCTADPALFRRSFGFTPDCEWGNDDDPAVPDLSDSAPRLTNSGGTIRLLSPDGAAVDVLFYGNAS